MVLFRILSEEMIIDNPTELSCLGGGLFGFVFFFLYFIIGFPRTILNTELFMFAKYIGREKNV